MAIVLAPTAAASTSADFVIPAISPTLIMGIRAASDVPSIGDVLYVEVKLTNGTYVGLSQLRGNGPLAAVLPSSGVSATYRVRKDATSVPMGVEALIPSASGSTATTTADGGSVAIGSTTDAAQTNPASAATLVALNKGQVQALFATGAASINVQGNTAKGSATVGNPVGVGGTYRSSPQTYADGQRTDLQTDAAGNLSVIIRSVNNDTVAMGLQTTDGSGASSVGLQTIGFNRVLNAVGTWDRQRGSAGDGTIVKPYAFTTSDWTYAAASGGVTNTTAVPLKAAAGAGVRNYLTGFSFHNTAAMASEFQILDGATVIYRGIASASMLNPSHVQFPTPLRTTANTALNVQMVTTATVTYFNAQGYVAP